MRGGVQVGGIAKPNAVTLGVGVRAQNVARLARRPSGVGVDPGDIVVTERALDPVEMR